MSETRVIGVLTKPVTQMVVAPLRLASSSILMVFLLAAGVRNSDGYIPSPQHGSVDKES